MIQRDHSACKYVEIFTHHVGSKIIIIIITFKELSSS
jgi:hypothetical protein